MEDDMSDVSDCHAPSSEGLVAVPVDGGSSGEGLPYAPNDWPHPGDKWRWKAGRRPTVSGYYRDRFIYPPSCCMKSTGGKKKFRSKITLENCIGETFPAAEVKDLMSSFLWNIRCSGSIQRKEMDHCSFTSEVSGSESPVRDEDCKVRNRMCSLHVNAGSYVGSTKACNIRCSEDGFCCDCCCILCCETIDVAYGGYSFLRCGTKMDGNYTCGHVVHLDCALRSYMAGTVGGSIGLDVQYYCRRCHNKTDLIPHVTKFIETCESLDSQDAAAKILTLGLCLLHGSEKAPARILRNQIERLMAKIKGDC